MTTFRSDGIRLCAAQAASGQRLAAETGKLRSWLASYGFEPFLCPQQGDGPSGAWAGYGVQGPVAARWAPGHDTTGLGVALGLDIWGSDRDLEREILAAMLLAPVPLAFPSFDELLSAVRLRRRIVQAGRRTVLAFDTEHAERPPDDWAYEDATGFTLRPGRTLADALRRATQPGISGRLYSFSCYRATEYVLLLALAEELAEVNAPLLAQLQRQWQRRAIRSGEFHAVFLDELGSLADPLPLRYYVPGDRVWFRNPDEASAGVEGYEGSWVLYLGDGCYTNFWARDRHFSLQGKCVELYHWRDAVRTDAQGRRRIDEGMVAARVRASLGDAGERARILARMERLRDPPGVYGTGGCLDASRESLRWVRPGSCTISLPQEAAA